MWSINPLWMTLLSNKQDSTSPQTVIMTCVTELGWWLSTQDVCLKVDYRHCTDCSIVSAVSWLTLHGIWCTHQLVFTKFFYLSVLLSSVLCCNEIDCLMSLSVGHLIELVGQSFDDSCWHRGCLLLDYDHSQQRWSHVCASSTVQIRSAQFYLISSVTADPRWELDSSCQMSVYCHCLLYKNFIY